MKTPYDKDKYFLFLIIVGLGLTTAWSWGTFQEGHLFIQFPQLLSISPEHAFFFFPLFNAIFFTLMAKYTFFFNGNKFFKQLLLFSVFSLFLLLPRTPSHLSIWMDFASISIASAALALFDGGWMWLGTNLSPQKAVLVFSAANMLASLIMAVHPWFPPSFLLLITGAFPLVSALFWGKSFNFSFSSSELPHLRPQTSFKGKWLAPLHFGLAIRIFLFFLACSIFHHHILSSSGTETISHFFFSELMYGAGALTAALLVYKIPKIKLRHIYILAQILIGTGFLLISPFYGFSGWISILPITLLQFGFGCFGAYAWATLVGLASRAPKEHALSVASKGLALIAGSVFIGQNLIFLLNRVSGTWNIPNNQLLWVAGVISLLLAGLFFHDNPETFANENLDKQEKHGLAPLSQTERHHLLLLPYDLTKQETKIALLLAENLNNSEICDSLNISENTLKTHLRNIYRKTKASGREDVQRIFS